MLVLHQFVTVLMSVALRQVQPDARSHERRRHAESDGQRVAQEKDGNGSANERRDGEIGPVRAVPTCRSASTNRVMLRP